MNTQLVCYYCHNVGDKLKWCGGCYAVKYCSKHCQVANWSEHKARCGVNSVISIDVAMNCVKELKQFMLCSKLTGILRATCSIWYSYGHSLLCIVKKQGEYFYGKIIKCDTLMTKDTGKDIVYRVELLLPEPTQDIDGYNDTSVFALEVGVDPGDTEYYKKRYPWLSDTDQDIAVLTFHCTENDAIITLKDQVRILY
jgi:hypothetical protein